MRLRQSNQGKHFRPSDFAPDLEISDDDRSSAAVRRKQPGNESSEEEFVVQEADVDLLDEDDDNLRDRDSSELGAAAAENRRPKRPRKQGPPPTVEENLSEVPPYPTDPSQRWTRSYIGPVKRWTRFAELTKFWFGDRRNYAKVVNGITKLWWEYEVVPPRLQSEGQLARAQNGWMQTGFWEDQETKFRHWYERYLKTRTSQQTSTLLGEAAAFPWFPPHVDGELSVLLGHVSNQKEYRMGRGQSICFSDAGNPIEDADDAETKGGGWIIHVGGIVMSMGWAPARGQVNQLLAIASVPYSDQAFYRDLTQAPKESEKKEGTVQIWRFEAEKDHRGVLRPAKRLPKLVHAICFTWGRVMRMQWCPVPLAIDNQKGLLAVLCSDKKLRVLLVRDSAQDSRETFEEIQEPMLTIEAPKEQALEITCFTWINMNRIAAGLSDGSVVVWSISPYRCLQRHPIHSSAIMDIVSSYPSDPFIVSTIPMGGLLTITDLNRPNAEVSYHPNMLVSLQPNLLAWSDHLRGFASIWPSAFPGNSNIAFVHARVFPLSRHLCTVEGQPTCLSIGTCHPYILVGATDGSVWVINMLRKISTHRKKTYKMRLLQHEYRPPLESPEGDIQEQEQRQPLGACRILHGFLPELNSHPVAARGAETQSKTKKKQKGGKQETKEKKGTAKGRSTAKSKGPSTEGEAAPDETKDVEMDGEGITSAAGPITLHESLTRITYVSWNPNARFGWWAAAAMGSGLVRIMDLGIESARSGEADDDDDVADSPASNNDDGAYVDDYGTFEDVYDVDEGEDMDEDEETDGEVDMVSWMD
ncbi:WD40-repeat-containing domain protein [Biscogniauxia mediterranea]|nr:WD40-repeat-containing domain protein [Biscogniauxia mediterranea]